MRSPSSHSAELLRAASSPELTGAALLEVLTALGRTCEPAVLPGLVPFVLYPDAAVAEAARQAALSLLLATPAHELVWLDQTLRGWSRHRAPVGLFAFDAWDRLKPGWLKVLAQQPQGLAVLLLASLHHDGYVRQAAVDHLSSLPVSPDAQTRGVEVPFLLLRLNDWVGPVQQVAVAGLMKRLSAANAPYLVRSLHLIQQLAIYRRRNHEDLLRSLQQFIGSPACRPALLAGLRAADRRVQRNSFLLLLGAEGADVRQIVLEGLRSSDMLVRVWAARTARRRLYGRDLVEALGQVRSDRAVPVRMEAVYAFVDDHPELQVLLLDPCKSIRETVRFYIRKNANLDFAALYRSALSGATPATLPVILLSLGETGRPSDAESLVPYVRHPQIRVRKAALQALGEVGGAAQVAVLYEAMADPHPGVARVAWEALRRKSELLTPEQLKVWLELRARYAAPSPG